MSSILSKNIGWMKKCPSYIISFTNDETFFFMFCTLQFTCIKDEKKTENFSPRCELTLLRLQNSAKVWRKKVEEQKAEEQKTEERKAKQSLVKTKRINEIQRMNETENFLENEQQQQKQKQQ